jgi:hypothetical protein
MRPAYRSGSSSEALSAARRTQLNRGLGLVLGVFAVYALASCFLPGLLPLKVYGGYRVGELVAAAQVLVIALGVLCHDRHARRHVEPLAQRVVTREREPSARAEETQTRPAWTPGASPSLSSRRATGPSPRPRTSEPSGDEAPFNAFDSSRAFGAGQPQGTGARRTVRATP